MYIGHQLETVKTYTSTESFTDYEPNDYSDKGNANPLVAFHRP